MLAKSRMQELFLGLSQSEILAEVRAQKESGATNEEIIRDLHGGIMAVDDAFGEGRMFVADLVVSAEIFRLAVDIIMPDSESGILTPIKSKGKVVIGTAKDDLHDIGKGVTSSLLRAAGYEVIDIGVDASPSDFVDAARKSGARIMAISCLLTTCMPSIISTIEELKRTGLSSRVKTIVGGAPLSAKFAGYCGADAYGPHARDAVIFADSVYAKGQAV
ncbi:MAG: cobalamin-dependent protein [Clostridiales Family XIII bacterium]|jgi:methylmalonyl-CoA mutase cobalamin-binding domain/chain|nr:cobalamin-dependent protein [Clostridiales Family XIII bacterium]